MRPFNLINQWEITLFKSHLCRRSKLFEADKRLVISVLNMKGIYLANALAPPSSYGWEGFLQWCHNPADHKMVQHFGHARVGWHVQRASLTLALVSTSMFWNSRSLLTAVKQCTKSIQMKMKKKSFTGYFFRESSSLEQTEGRILA